MNYKDILPVSVIAKIDNLRLEFTHGPDDDPVVLFNGYDYFISSYKKLQGHPLT